jgi:hypothetical protein
VLHTRYRALRRNSASRCYKGYCLVW